MYKRHFYNEEVEFSLNAFFARLIREPSSETIINSSMGLWAYCLGRQHQYQAISRKTRERV